MSMGDNYLPDYLTQLELEISMDPAITDDYTMGYRAGFNDAIDKMRREYELTGFSRLGKALAESWDKT